MLKVKRILDNKIFTVYDTSHNMYDTFFLIFSDEWVWANAKDFVPHEENFINIPSYVPIPYYPYPPSNIPNTPIDDWWKQPYVTWTASNNKTE